MIYEGNLKKMRTIHESPVKYYLTLGEEEINMNSLIGKQVNINYNGRINCIRCNTLTQKSFHQGYCYSCFISSPECDAGVLNPEKDQAHLGISRDMEWAKQNSLIDHYVYLAITGNLKVGVTRHTQIPFRWIDQGAWQAIVLAITPNRFIAGSIEVALKKHFQDKTNWRIMLSSANHNGFDLVKEKEKALKLLHPDFQKYGFADDSITEIHYPVVGYPVKVKSVGFDKQPVIRGILTGIKGQYLMFRSGEVLNIRKHGGYLVDLSF